MIYVVRTSYLYLRIENSDVDTYEQEIEKKVIKSRHGGTKQTHLCLKREGI